jgi:hypothetical protein
MQVSEAQRRELYDRVRAHLDEETATLLLEVTMPANVELATRGDIQELRAEMLLGFTQLEARQNERLAGVEQRLSGVEQRLSGVEQRLSGVEQRFGRLESRLLKVGVPIFTAIVTVIVGLATWIGMSAG